MSSELNPYASPAVVDEAAPDGTAVMSTRYVGFRPPVYLTRGLCLLLGLQLTSGVLLAIAMGVWYWDLGQHYDTGMDPERFNQHSAVQAPLGAVEYALHLSVTILFLFWLYRIHSNLIFLDNQQLEFTPGWAVGWFFIPIANLVKPYQVVREAWRASDPKTVGRDVVEWSALSSAVLVGWWWAFRLAIAFGGSMVTALQGNPETVDEYQQATLFSIAFFLAVDIPYLLIHWRLVRRIYGMQLARYAQLLAALPRPDADASPFA